MKEILVHLFLIVGIVANGQAIELGRDSINTVTVHADPRFDELAAKQAEINRRAQKMLPKRVQGWRIQAANTQNRDEANAVKAEMLRRFPEHKAYLLYQSPNFRVRVGDFLTQKDAFRLRKMISALYPGKGIYIVPDVVEIAPQLEEEEIPVNR
jgi:hypothetical protein